MSEVRFRIPDITPHIKRLGDDAQWRMRYRLNKQSALIKRVNNKVILITGSSDGIGAASAKELAKAGAIVLLTARSMDKLKRVEQDIRDAGGQAFSYACDVSDMDACDALCTRVLAEHGHVDILINNAGRSIRRDIIYSTDRFHDYERTMQLNYFGAVRLATNLIPTMVARKSGQIINVSSVGVKNGVPRFTAYVASKSALEGWSLSAQNELVHTGVCVTCINYPLVRTAMIAPTKIYRYVPALNLGQAVDWMNEAIVLRPKRIWKATAKFSAAMYDFMPRTAEFIVNTTYQMLVDENQEPPEKHAKSLAEKQQNVTPIKTAKK